MALFNMTKDYFSHINRCNQKKRLRKLQEKLEIQFIKLAITLLLEVYALNKLLP
jgi:hypothetical protein